MLPRATRRRWYGRQDLRRLGRQQPTRQIHQLGLRADQHAGLPAAPGSRRKVGTHRTRHDGAYLDIELLYFVPQPVHKARHGEFSGIVDAVEGERDVPAHGSGGQNKPLLPATEVLQHGARRIYYPDTFVLNYLRGPTASKAPARV